MKKIAIIPNPTKDVGLKVTNEIIRRLLRGDIEPYIHSKYRVEAIAETTFYDELPNDVELIIVTGGDGSVIDASVEAIAKDVPLLGVNLGKVGYLSEVDPSGLDILDKLFTGEYTLENKMLLSVFFEKDGELIYSSRLGVNDIIISHDTFLGIADIKLENSSGERVKYRADGMILSTPAGTTAYSLSAGGPIVAHDIDSIVATPICPHSFFNRSIMFNPNERIKISNIGKPSLNVSVDGRFFTTLKEGEACCVEMSEKRLKMLTFNKNNTFSTLFKKMRILEDM